ncbi:MAG: pitrilysin family protein [bacterium]|nr:pitrilysin family protein [bacterium]
MLKRVLLPNGLRVLFYPMKSTEAATILFLARAGSKYETKDLNGISHLLEHLLFRGTRKWPKPTSISQELDQIGGFYNAFTDKEILGIVIKVGTENFSLAVDILADMVISPLFKEDGIAKEKKVVVEEINMREDDSQTLVLDLWEKLLYGDQPAGWLTIGTKETVGLISRKDLFRHLRDSFVAKNSTVVVAGNLKEDEVRRGIEKRFSVLDKTRGKEKLSAKENQKESEVLLHYKKTDQTHLCLGVRTVDAFSPKKYPLAVISALLGGMMSSRLFVEVREKRGLAYYLRTFSEHYTDTGYLVTHAGLNNEKVLEAVKIICRQYQKLKTEKISGQELTKIKENLRGRLKLGLETSDDFASFYGLQEILGGEVLSPDQKWQKIAKITPDDILKVAREFFQPQKLNLALIGPCKDKEKILRVLKRI